MARLPKILVGLPSRGMWPVAFEETLAGAILGHDVIFSAYKVYANWHIPDDARNSFVCTALQKDMDFIFFMDTDMQFPKGCLGMMLRHITQIPGDKPPVLAGVYCSRSGDHRWHVYKDKDEKGMWKSMKFPLKSGILQADIAGTGCMLLDVNVFRSIPMPWFEYKYINLDEENWTYQRMSEDFVFCEKLKEAEIPIYIDTDIACGHLHSVQIWPTEDAGFEVKTYAGEVY